MNLSLRLDDLRTTYRNGELTPRQLLLGLREKAAALNPDYHLFIHLLTAEELEPYLTALESRDLESLPLYGVPFAIKDNIDLAGIPTTAACPAFAYVPPRSATIVEQLLALGAIPLGKTNLDQFATGLNGTRSPYGACRNSVLPDYPAGGSSAGSSLAVALGVASFALGTDTAGSGRVPAALNNLVGLKATLGLISTAGVVPACRTLDCVTTFTATAKEASQLLALTARPDPRDDYSRHNPQWNDGAAFGVPRRFRFGVPRQQDLAFFGCQEGPQLFLEAIERLERLGGEAVELDLSPFLEAARLLYEGPWVAERYSVAGPLMEREPEAVLPVIRAVLAKAPTVDGVQTFRARYRLQALKAQCDRAMDALDCVITPTIGRPVTLAELASEPSAAQLGTGVLHQFHEPAGLRRRCCSQYVHGQRLALGRDAVRSSLHRPIPLERGRCPAASTGNDFASARQPGAPRPGTAGGVWRTPGRVGAELSAQATRCASDRGHPKLSGLPPLCLGRRPSPAPRHASGQRGRRGNRGGDMGTAEQRTGFIPDWHPRTVGAGQGATGRWSLGKRIHLRVVWPGRRTGHQSSGGMAGLFA